MTEHWPGLDNNLIEIMVFRQIVLHKVRLQVFNIFSVSDLRPDQCNKEEGKSYQKNCEDGHIVSNICLREDEVKVKCSGCQS